MDALAKGYEPAWQLLYQDIPVENIIDENFMKLTEQYIMPLWRVCHGN